MHHPWLQNTALDAAALVDGLTVAVVQDACSAAANAVLSSSGSESALAKANVRVVQAADVIVAAAECDEELAEAGKLAGESALGVV